MTRQRVLAVGLVAWVVGFVLISIANLIGAPHPTPVSDAGSAAMLVAVAAMMWLWRQRGRGGA